VKTELPPNWLPPVTDEYTLNMNKRVLKKALFPPNIIYTSVVGMYNVGIHHKI
jgi:hypothetical protein